MLESLKKIKADLLKAAYEIADEKQYKTDLNTYERMLLKLKKIKNIKEDISY